MREVDFRLWVNSEKKLIYHVTVSAFHVNVGEKYYFHKDDVVLEQFTGLHDKNGNKIYEGDIIRVWFDEERNCPPEPERHTWSEDFEVYFDEKYHSWFTRFQFSSEPNEWLYEYDEDCEVVGNIHEAKLEANK